MCYFIAPSIFIDTERQIKFVKQEDNILIVPKTIISFVNYLDENKKLYANN